MDWLVENWFWIAIAIFFIWMHLGGHCGGHGGHGLRQEDEGRNEAGRAPGSAPVMENASDPLARSGPGASEGGTRC